MTEINVKPGDCLLYHSHSAFGWFIRSKTWSDVSHVEVYLGSGKSFASRDGQGVNIYDLKTKDLSYVLRPKEPLNFEKGHIWVTNVIGKKYDWWGLLRFFRLSKCTDDKMYCSEAAARYYNACDFYPFYEKYVPCDVAPSTFLTSPKFDWIHTPGE